MCFFVLQQVFSNVARAKEYKLDGYRLRLAVKTGRGVKLLGKRALADS
jgi:ATP-dependent DNA ligase